MNAQHLKNQLSELEKTAKTVRERIENFTLDEKDLTDAYDEMLDEHMVKIGDLTYLTSDVLKSVDEVAYYCGLSDYVNSIDLHEIQEYAALIAELEELELEIKSLKIELEEFSS